MSLFNELRRRNVFKVGVAYLVVAWLLLQIVAVVAPILALPVWIPRAILLMLTIGFPIALVIAWAFELTPEGIKPTHTVPEDESIRPQTGQKLNRLIIGALSLALVLVIVDSYILPDSNNAEADAETQTTAVQTGVSVPATAEAVVNAADKSIAVLPFANLSSDPEQEYFSDGLSEEILNKLAKVNGLQVVARTSSFYFKGRNEDMRTIGETLNVANILEGSVRKSGTQLRISAQLINAATGFELWSDNFDRNLEDVFAVQDEIAAAVTTALSVSLGAGEFDLPGMTRNVEAYEAYLKANADFQETGITAVNAAIARLKESVNIDPGFGLGWLELARAYNFARIVVPADQIAEVNRSRNEALEKARRAAPDMPRLLLADAQQLLQDGDWLAVETILQGLLENNNALTAQANDAYGSFLVWTGQAEAALPYLQRAKRLNPLNPGIAHPLGVANLALGRTGETETEADWGISFGDARLNTFLLGNKMFAAYMDGDPVRAAEMVRAGGAPPGELYIQVADLLAAGDKEAALAAIRGGLREDMSALQKVALSTPASLAGDTDLALELYFGVSGGTPSTFGVINTWIPLNREIRQSPEFHDLVERTGLANYWRTTGNWNPYCQPLAGNDDFECF